MNEERYAYRVRQTLNFGLKDIPPAASRRLEAARHLALARQKQAEPQLVTAGTHPISSRLLRLLPCSSACGFPSIGIASSTLPNWKMWTAPCSPTTYPLMLSWITTSSNG